MKKFTTLVVSFILLTSLLSCAFAATYTKFSRSFIKNFEDCDKYTETITSEFESENFTTIRKIKGWQNGFCNYEENIKSKDAEYQLNCKFSSLQVDDLYNAMRKNQKKVDRFELDQYIEQKESNGNIKYVKAGTTTIKGNPAFITWAKYQNNPYICTPQKLR